ncbi:MAG TPA: hypothetical protein VGH28_26575 [Polyangiaceae bacterium]|jgi:hypothetical protein
MARSSEWVVVRHYDDGLNAQIALDFLRDHGVPVALRGNSGATAVLNRFDTVLDVRLVVRSTDLAQALEALTALESPGTPIESREELAPASGHPYRDTSEIETEVRRRYRRAAFALAFMLPIGSGHFYAGENVAGSIFAAAVAIFCVAAMVTRGDGFFLGAMFVVVCDALTAVSAVDRHNAGAPASPRAQALRAGACAIFAALAATFVR